MTQSLINLVAAWGYIAIFVTMVAESAGLPISSEIVVPLGGALASGLSRGHLRLANRFFDRFGLWAVFLGRLLPIVRTYISFPAGLSRISYLRFTLATLAGAIPWNFALAYAGYNLGQHYETVAATLGPFAIPIAIAVVILLAVVWWFGRKAGEDEEAAIQEEERAKGVGR